MDSIYDQLAQVPERKAESVKQSMYDQQPPTEQQGKRRPSGWMVVGIAIMITGVLLIFMGA